MFPSISLILWLIHMHWLNAILLLLTRRRPLASMAEMLVVASFVSTVPRMPGPLS